MKRSIPFSLLAAFAAAGFAAAEPVYTNPVGYVTQNVPPSTFTFVGITLHAPTITAGVLNSSTSNSVTDTDVDFVTLLTAGSTYILELENGTIQEVTSWNAFGVLSTPEDISSQVTNGVTTYKLRKAATIADIFGIGNSAGLTSSPDGNLAVADVINVVTTSGLIRVYYYNDGSEQGWFTSGGQPAANIPVIYADGFYIKRASGAPLDLIFSGELKTRPTSSVLTVGFNYVSSVAPVGLTLNNSGLENWLSQSSDGNINSVDNVLIPQPGGSFITAYYYNDGTEFGWFNAGGTDLGATSINGGFLIRNRGITKPYRLEVPASFVNP